MLILAMQLALTGFPMAGETPRWAAAWPAYRVLVWQYQTPPPGDQALAAYASAGLRGIHLDHGFSDRLLRFAIDHDLPYYVDHAAGKGDLYLRRGEWQPFHQRYKRDRGLAARPRSLSDPAVIARMKRLLTEHVTRAKEGPVLAYAFDDEISTTSFTTPVDLDWSEHARGAFRAWLRETYGTIEVLNAEWGTRYRSFDEAEPLPTDALRDVHGRPFTAWNLSRWCDHRSFMDHTLATVLADLVEVANAIDPRHPAGFVGGQAPAAYGGMDYSLLAPAVQFMEAYDIGATNEILRSLFRPARKPHVQTFFATLDEARDRWFLWYYFVHGNRGAIAWPASQGASWFADGRARPEIAALKPTFDELQGPLAELLTDADFVSSRIALYYSQPSIQVSWFMDIQPHGGTWVNRSSSLNNQNASDIMNRWAWVKLLEDSGYQYEFVTAREAAAGRIDRRRLDALILNRALALSEAEAAAIRAFVAAGGTVIADYLPGVFDAHGKGRPGGVLDDLFGVARDPAAGVLDGQTIAEVNGEFYQRPLAERLSYRGAIRWDGKVVYERGLSSSAGEAELAGGTAVLVRKGRARYLNLSPVEYLLHREDAVGEGWRALLADELAGSGVRPLAAVTVNGRSAPTVEVLHWRRSAAPSGESEVWCVVANHWRLAESSGAGRVSGGFDTDPVRLGLVFEEPRRSLRNLRTGRRLGDGREFEDTWMPCEANIYVAAE